MPDFAAQGGDGRRVGRVLFPPGGTAVHFEGANNREALKPGISSRVLFISAEGDTSPEA